MKITVRKKVFFMSLCLLAFLSLSFRINQIAILDFIGFALGLGWMLYNIFGFTFDRDMSLRGKISFSSNGNVIVRRRVVFCGTIFIYLMLIIGLIRS